MSLSAERGRRWQLVLGSAEPPPENESGGQDSAEGDGSRDREQQMSPVDKGMEEALSALYGDSRGGDLSQSMPDVSRWLGDIRTYFPRDVVDVMQRDALKRMDPRRLVEEPELLAGIEPDAALAAKLLSLRKVMPPRTLETARQVVARVVDDLVRRIEYPLQQAISGRLDRATHTHRPRKAQEIDWNRTIRANLKHYRPELGTIIPERLVGFGRRRPTLKDVILLVDTSGSMSTSVVYSGIIAAVLASVPSLNTRLIMFDTAVVDLTDRLDDPVGMLFGLRLGGGTNIDQALTYARGAITRPRDTIVVLISDLFEGGNKERMVRQVGQMLADGVQFITLLALNDQGAARYNAAVAQELADLSTPAFACTPEQFPELLGRALSGRKG